MSIVRDIQAFFLPKNFVYEDLPLNIAGTMIPANLLVVISMISSLNERYFAFVIGDVSDKGVPAALFMAKSNN